MKALPLSTAIALFLVAVLLVPACSNEDGDEIMEAGYSGEPVAVVLAEHESATVVSSGPMTIAEWRADPLACSREPRRMTVFLAKARHGAWMTDRFGGKQGMSFGGIDVVAPEDPDAPLRQVKAFFSDPKQYEYTVLELDADIAIRCVQDRPIELMLLDAYAAKPRRFRRESRD